MKALVQLLVSVILMFHAAALQRQAAGDAVPSCVATATGQNSRPRANQGRLPPAPSWQAEGSSAERWTDGRINSTPHVNHDHWYGQDGMHDSRYGLPASSHVRMFAQAKPNYRYPILRVNRNLRRLWIPAGFFFDVAAWDWPLFSDWCWDCGDDFVLYGDPYHRGWYLLYNVHTGTYVHILYRGA